MKIGSFIAAMFLLPVYTAAYGQFNYDSIRVCHTEGELKEVLVGEYVLKVGQGRLTSLASRDSAVTYFEKDKLFILRLLNKGKSMKLQLTNEGVAVTSPDTAFVFDSPQSFGTSAELDNSFLIYATGGFSFVVDFKNGKVHRVTLVATGKYIQITIDQVDGMYRWNFYMLSSENLNKVTMIYGNKDPRFLSVFDSRNNVGIRLDDKEQNGFFSFLRGLRVDGKDSYFPDKSQVLQYDNKGRLERNSSKLILDCGR